MNAARARIEWIESSVTAADGARLAVYTHEPVGASETTPTVLLAHGWTLDHRSWEPVAALLAQSRDVRIVAWDQRGHGKSTLANGGRKSGGESVRALGDDLLTVLQTIPAASRVTLAGHSMGGMTVMAFAGLHPNVLSDRVSGVVLVATAAGKLRGAGLPGEVQLMKLLARVPLSLGRLVRPRAQRRTFGRNPRREDLIDACRQIGGTSLATTGTYYAALMQHDETAALPALDALGPTILVGTHDILTPPKLSQRLAEAMPHAELQIIEGSGHMLTYEATRQVADAIRARMN